MANPQQGMPTPQYPFVTQSTGQVSFTWYQFLLTLYNRTGGPSGDTSGAPQLASSVSNGIITANQLNGAVIVRSGPIGPFTDVTDSALNYIKAHSFPVQGSTNFIVFINTTAFSWTITPGSNVTFSGNLIGGNFQIPANSQKTFTIYIASLSSSAITIYG